MITRYVTLYARKMITISVKNVVLLGVHRNICTVLGIQMTIFYLVILVSYPKQHLVIGPSF